MHSVRVRSTQDPASISPMLTKAAPRRQEPTALQIWNPCDLGEFQNSLGAVPGNFIIPQPHIEQTGMELGISEAIRVVQFLCQRYRIGCTIVERDRDSRRSKGIKPIRRDRLLQDWVQYRVAWLVGVESYIGRFPFRYAPDPVVDSH